MKHKNAIAGLFIRNTLFKILFAQIILYGICSVLFWSVGQNRITTLGETLRGSADLFLTVVMLTVTAVAGSMAFSFRKSEGVVTLRRLPMSENAIMVTCGAVAFFEGILVWLISAIGIYLHGCFYGSMHEVTGIWRLMFAVFEQDSILSRTALCFMPGGLCLMVLVCLILAVIVALMTGLMLRETFYGGFVLMPVAMGVFAWGMLVDNGLIMAAALLPAGLLIGLLYRNLKEERAHDQKDI